jgi:hypothetical protein
MLTINLTKSLSLLATGERKTKDKSKKIKVEDLRPQDLNSI